MLYWGIQIQNSVDAGFESGKKVPENVFKQLKFFKTIMMQIYFDINIL